MSSRQTRRNNDAAALGRRRWVVADFTPTEKLVTFEKPTVAQLSNRYSYHAPKGDQAQRYQVIRDAVLTAAKVGVDNSPCSPEQARALNALDEAMFLFNAAVARTE